MQHKGTWFFFIYFMDSEETECLLY